MYINNIPIYRIYVLIILLLNINPLNAKTINVCSNCKIQTIEKAVQVASNGDTIIVKEGTYFEKDIEIRKSLTILGENAIIDAENKGGVFHIYADNTTIKGFTINNIKKSYTKDIAAIYTFGIKNFIFENNTFNNPFFALLIQRSSNGLIANNKIFGNAINEVSSANGIHLWHSSNVIIHNNIIDKMRDGIYLEFVKNSKIHHNISSNQQRYGLHFMFSNNNEYTHNVFEKNAAGVAVMFSKYISMNHNQFKDNWGTASFGLLLKEIYDADIGNNIFEKNTIGINVEGSSRVQYENNIFKNNGWALKITGGCYKNIFIQNDFINNSFDLSYNGRINENKFHSNYWSEYNGYDLDKDGIGDISYQPVKLFSYITQQTPESIILLRSLFIDLVNFSEKVSPLFISEKIKDHSPQIKMVNIAS